MESGAIPDGQLQASSEWDQLHGGNRARLHITSSGSYKGAWSARSNDRNQWLQIDLGSPLNIVTGVATQGRQDYDQWVTTYRVAYGDDGVNFQEYKEPGQSIDKVQ